MVAKHWERGLGALDVWVVFVGCVCCEGWLCASCADAICVAGLVGRAKAVQSGPFLPSCHMARAVCTLGAVVCTADHPVQLALAYLHLTYLHRGIAGSLCCRPWVACIEWLPCTALRVLFVANQP
jgi:hypothetical protein